MEQDILDEPQPYQNVPQPLQLEQESQDRFSPILNVEDSNQQDHEMQQDSLFDNSLFNMQESQFTNRSSIKTQNPLIELGTQVDEILHNQINNCILEVARIIAISDGLIPGHLRQKIQQLSSQLIPVIHRQKNKNRYISKPKKIVQQHESEFDQAINIVNTSFVQNILRIQQPTEQIITALKAIHIIFNLPYPKTHPWETLRKFFVQPGQVVQKFRKVIDDVKNQVITVQNTQKAVDLMQDIDIVNGFDRFLVLEIQRIVQQIHEQASQQEIIQKEEKKDQNNEELVKVSSEIKLKKPVVHIRKTFIKSFQPIDPLSKQQNVQEQVQQQLQEMADINYEDYSDPVELQKLIQEQQNLIRKMNSVKKQAEWQVIRSAKQNINVEKKQADRKELQFNETQYRINQAFKREQKRKQIQTMNHDELEKIKDLRFTKKVSKQENELNQKDEMLRYRELSVWNQWNDQNVKKLRQIEEHTQFEKNYRVNKKFKQDEKKQKLKDFKQQMKQENLQKLRNQCKKLAQDKETLAKELKIYV